MPSVNPGTVILNGENPFIWLSETIRSAEDEVVMSWFDMHLPLLVSDETVSDLPLRPYGVSAVTTPAERAAFTVNGQQARGQIWPMDLDGHAFTTGALAFSESWRE
ncbi:hypothetical protein [Pseudovibrio sp. Ad26]|uniref:hypothetical protein n=1 Tax=Pseudovibrio sp. Ad26 TaxID=989410 RepID=UPI0007AE79E4|nr:hypothetical protein [Pseudovibrio sp. Ad26]KZL13320.1 hypothetical protein PsAD26_02090 [Pseudovibrio sp. Ad26]